ncbi:unnamed protein product [Closterium sp. NIES-54]
MDVEKASWKSTGTYVDEVPPPGANIVSGMWIFRVKRPPGSPPVFKARYVAKGFSQRQGVDYFQTFSPTPKMTTLRVLLHVAAQRDYELHSLDFSTAFQQGSLHEEIWLRRPPGFTGLFPPGTQWSLRRPVYGLRQAPREWHDTLRTTLSALGFAPSTTEPSLFLRTDTSLPPFYILVYVDDLVFATADTAGLAHVKSELQKRHTCTDLGELRSYLGLQITRDRARCTITLTQSHMVQQVLQRFDFTYSSPQATPLSTRQSLSALPSDESVEPSGPYPELVGCLIHRPEHMAAAKRVLRYLCSTSGMGLVLGGRSPVVLTGHADASWVDDLATQRSSHGYTFSLGSGSVSWRSTLSSSVLSSSCEAEIYAGAMAAQELRWLTYLLTDLGEPPRSPPVLYVDNKAMLALCREHRLEHRTKHIAFRYFLARELQQRGQLRLAYVASQANTADIFTKALQPCDHQRFCTMLAEKRNEPPPSKIEALDGSNYEEWSGRMRSAFTRYKLLKLVMGEEKMPEEGDARDQWIEKSAVLYDLILQSVHNDMFQHIKDLVELDDSEPKAWKLLLNVIQPNTLPMVIVLEKELAALSMRPGDDVKPVLDKIKDTYARMAAVGSNVSQMQQCTKIISLLHNSWDNLIPTLNTQQDQWTPEWLRQQILQEDFRRRHTGGGAANKTAEGYGAAGGSRGRGGGRGRGRGRGFGRGRGGAKAPLELVHMDVVGPTRAPSLLGSRYFLTIVDDHTRAVWVYPLKTKGEVATAVLKEWMPRAQRESGHKVKVIRTDNGGEFIGADFESVLKKKGIQHQLTVPYNPQQNGVAERFNRTVQEGSRTLLGCAGLLDPFWVTALRQVALVKNRVLATVGDKQWVPYTKWYGSASAVNMLRAYGCMVVFHVPKEKRGKLEASGRLGVHLGLAKDQKGWLIWELTSQQLTVSRDVKFLESLYYKEWKQQQKLLTTPLIIEADEVQRPSRQVQVTVSEEEIYGVTEDGVETEVEEQQQQDAPQGAARPADRPRRDVRPPNRLTYPSFGKPKVQSVKEEFDSLLENETWELCELPPGKKAISSKLIFRHKYGPDGELTRYKSRLVAKGFQQTKGTDFDEIFAPVGKETTLRVMLGMAANRGWRIKQMDITTAFLNGIILEELYMLQPEGLDDGSGRVCRLKKAIYGLTQAPRAWYHKLEETLLAGGFKKSECDHSLFLLQEKEQFLMLLVYVDDIMLFSKSSAMIEHVEEMLEMQFKCSKMGDVKYYLGMHVERDLDKGSVEVAPEKRLQRGAADLGKGEMLLTCYTDASFNSVKADGTSIGGYVCLFGGGAVS